MAGLAKVRSSAVLAAEGRCGVYVLRHMLSNAFYVGATRDFIRRRREHFRTIQGRRGAPRGLAEFGKNVSNDLSEFTFAPLLVCAPEHALMYEDRALNVLYGTPGCLNANRAGNMPTDESRRRRAMHGDKHPQFGKPLSVEVRAKIRATLTGRVVPPAHCAAIRASKIGKPLSLEHCAAITKGKTGKQRKPFSDEWRAKLSAARVAYLVRKAEATG